MELPSAAFLTTTENQLTGYRIVERLGVVRGICVRSRCYGTAMRVVHDRSAQSVAESADVP